MTFTSPFFPKGQTDLSVLGQAREGVVKNSRGCGEGGAGWSICWPDPLVALEPLTLLASHCALLNKYFQRQMPLVTSGVQVASRVAERVNGKARARTRVPQPPAPGWASSAALFRDTGHVTQAGKGPDRGCLQSCSVLLRTQIWVLEVSRSAPWLHIRWYLGRYKELSRSLIGKNESSVDCVLRSCLEVSVSEGLAPRRLLYLGSLSLSSVCEFWRQSLSPEAQPRLQWVLATQPFSSSH